jgi:endonuclease/exonuclease/phosphatase family metal-dependent hydrolase
MRIATFNVENLFNRPWALNQPNHATGQPVLDDMARLNFLLKQKVFTAAIKSEIERLADRYALLDRQLDPRERKLILRQVRGKLWIDRQDGTREWVAAGADDFLGWVELTTEPIDDRAIDNTARVLAAVDADIQILVEVENRVTLQRFHDEMLTQTDRPDAVGRVDPYTYALLMDGNDARGIDIGVLSRVPVSGMRSHVHLRNQAGNALFSRDCAMFVFDLAQKQRLVVFGNHFSSQASDKSGRRRAEQSRKVAELVDAALAWTPLVIVCGDLNEAPARGNMQALLAHPELKDAMAMPQYPDRETLPGTYKTASASTKLDYLLLSSALQRRVRRVGVERRGYKSTKWPHFPTVTDERSQASDHHCLWVDLDF